MVSVLRSRVGWAFARNNERTTGNIHKPIPMSYLDSGFQRLRSQQAVEVAKASASMLGCQSPSCSCMC